VDARLRAPRGPHGLGRSLLLRGGTHEPHHCFVRRSRCIDRCLHGRRSRGWLRTRLVLQVLANQIEQIEAAVAALGRQLLAWHKTNPVSQRLASIPGIGPIIATAIASTVADPNVFRSGREFAAWLGLVPRQNSTGGYT
jgi:transposase